MGTHPSLTLWDMLTTNFECRRTLLGHWQCISGNGGESGGRFDRGRVEGCVVQHIRHLRGWTIVGPQNRRAGRREVLGRGNGPRVDGGKGVGIYGVGQRC